MSNGRLTKHLEFEVYEAPMLAHALRIARNTAMMCGHPGAQVRLEEMLAQVKESIPEVAGRFNEEVFAEIGAALQECVDDETVLVVWEPASWQSRWSKTGYLQVRIRDKGWRSDRADVPRASNEQAAVADYFKQIAGADIRVETPSFEEA